MVSVDVYLFAFGCGIISGHRNQYTHKVNKPGRHIYYRLFLSCNILVSAKLGGHLYSSFKFYRKMFFVSYFGEKRFTVVKYINGIWVAYGGEMFLPFVISKTSIGYVSFQMKPFMGTWYGYIIGNFQAYLGNGTGII